MVKINKEDALVYRNTVMRMVQEHSSNQHYGKLYTLPELREAAKSMQGIDDYLCRVLGLDPETVENWYD